MNLYDFILETVSEALSVQDRSSGAMPGGHNGPYRDDETPVRNTAHWIITFLKAFEITGDAKFSQAAEAGIEYLLSREARPGSATFLIREEPTKDRCNGLIGQAWCIEALVEAADVLERSDLISLAEEIFLLHPQEEERAVWKRVEIDGTVLSVDETFNHQLWFAAAGASLLPYAEDEIRKRILRFADRLQELFIIHHYGLIHHPLAGRHNRFKEHVKCLLSDYLPLRQKWNRQKIKEIGYHAFNLYGFALLKQFLPDHSFWSSSKFRKALDYVDSPRYLNGIDGNPYGYPYNPPGIEVAFSLQVFRPDKKDRISDWLSRQFEVCYSRETKMMELNSSDPVTSAARIYEATRINNVVLT